jgi:Na+/melibiose symporter-like transporter
MCPNGGCPVPVLQGAFPIVGVVLFLDSLVCLFGLRSAFFIGGVLSAVIAAITLYNWAGASGGEVWASLVVVSLASVILDILAVRPRGQLKEQANPMNLPVFG